MGAGRSQGSHFPTAQRLPSRFGVVIRKSIISRAPASPGPTPLMVFADAACSVSLLKDFDLPRILNGKLSSPSLLVASHPTKVNDESRRGWDVRTDRKMLSALSSEGLSISKRAHTGER